MANITGDWNKNMPSGSSLISEGDDLMRQHWRSLQSTLNDEHYFSDSKKSAGLHKTGSARIFVGPASQRSSKPTAQDVIPGRVYFERETGDMYTLGSAETRVNYSPAFFFETDSTWKLRPQGDSSYVTFTSINFQVGNTSGQTWGVLSNGSLTRAVVPSGVSGWFRFNVELRATAVGTSALTVPSSGKIRIYLYKNGGNSDYRNHYAGLASSNYIPEVNAEFYARGKAADYFTIIARYSDATGNGQCQLYWSGYKVG